MKLTKKQSSAINVIKATVTTGRGATDDVGNQRDSRLYGCSLAGPSKAQSRIHPTRQLRTTSRDKAMESIAGL